MDNTILKKKLSSYRSEKDQLRSLPPDILLEVLMAWEQWTGSSKEFYSSIGVSSKQIAGILGKAKKLRREGHFPASEFTEIKASDVLPISSSSNPCSGIELSWNNGQIIRFPKVDDLLDFLKKAA